ncbi:MAG: hypothetical protein LBC68_12185 [Prevotellaceae bacterium]|nr:hypothetical protein [Prevotellaceae bacterium]
MVNETIVNECCPVRDRMLVERNAVSYISREFPTVFHVIGSASRETHTMIFLPNVAFLWNGNL